MSRLNQPNGELPRLRRIRAVLLSALFLLSLGCAEEGEETLAPVRNDNSRPRAGSTTEAVQASQLPIRRRGDPGTEESENEASAAADEAVSAVPHEEIAAYQLDELRWFLEQQQAIPFFEDFSPQECFVCGRESGFIPRPAIRVIGISPFDGKGESALELGWDAVAGADFYRVYLWAEGELPGSLELWEGEGTVARLSLAPEREYVIILEAISRQDKRRSLPSEPVIIQCDQQRCVQLER